LNPMHDHDAQYLDDDVCTQPLPVANQSLELNDVADFSFYNYTPHLWVKLFSALDFGSGLPPNLLLELNETGSAAAVDVAKDYWEVPTVVVALALLVALFLLLRLCIDCGRSSRRKTPPPVKLFVLVSLMTGLVLWICALRSWWASAESYHILQKQISRLSTATDILDSEFQYLNCSVYELLVLLNRSIEVCPLTMKETAPVVSPTVVYLFDYVNYTADCLAPMPPMLASALESIDSKKQLIGVGYLFPTIMTSILCLLIISLVLCAQAHTSDRQHCAEIAEQCLKYGSLIVALAMVLLAILAAIKLGIGIVVSNVCTDPDGQMIQIITNYTDVWWPGDETIPQLLEYYINKQGDPQVFQYLRGAHNIVASLIAGEPIYQLPLNVLESHCSAIHDMKLVHTLTQLNETLVKADRLLNETYIYPFYKEIVHDCICGSMLKSFGWTVALQVVVSLLMLPTLALASDHYLEALQQKRRQNLGTDESQGYWPCCTDANSDTEERTDDMNMAGSASGAWTSQADDNDSREIRLLQEPSHNDSALHDNGGDIRDYARAEPSATRENSPVPAQAFGSPASNVSSRQHAFLEQSSPSYMRPAGLANDVTPRTGLAPPLSPVWHGRSARSPQIVPLMGAGPSGVAHIALGGNPPQPGYSAVPLSLTEIAQMQAASTRALWSVRRFDSVPSGSMPTASFLSPPREGPGCWCSTTPDRQQGLPASPSLLHAPQHRVHSTTSSGTGSFGSGHPLLTGHLPSPGRTK